MASNELKEGYRWGHDRREGRTSNAPKYGDKVHEGDKGYRIEEIRYREDKDKKIKPVEQHPRAKEIRRIERGK